MPKPEPNYAQQVQDLEQELARARLERDAARAVNDERDAAETRYEKRLTAYEQMLRQSEQQNSILLTRAVAAEEQSNAWMRRAMQYERNAQTNAERLKQIRMLVEGKACLIPQLQELTKEYL